MTSESYQLTFDNLRRVETAIAPTVMDFCRSKLGAGTWQMAELHDWCLKTDEHTAPASPDRILRHLRQVGLVDYEVVDRRGSLYRVKSVGKEICSKASEQQWQLIYAIIVAGKSYKFARRAIGALKTYGFLELPFDMIKRLIREKKLLAALKASRTGNYGKLERSMVELTSSNIDLDSCTPEQLEAIHGIGPKTARFFILWTRPDYRCAALDIHILRWLGTLGYVVPKNTPTGAIYNELEKAFLAEADIRNKSPRDLDFEVWDAASGYSNNEASVLRQEPSL